MAIGYVFAVAAVGAETTDVGHEHALLAFDVGAEVPGRTRGGEQSAIGDIGDMAGPASGGVFTRKFVARESPASLVRGWSASILFPGWPLPGVAAWPPLVGARHYRDWYECRGW